MSAVKVVLALLSGLGAASAANSDVCTTAANYDGDLVSDISGCASPWDCSSDGYYICDSVVSLMTSSYTEDITACGDTAIGGTTVTEADYTQLFSSCCTDGIGPCDPDHTAMCEDPTQYDGSATSGISGCDSTSTTLCDSSGYWTCDGAADYISLVMTESWSTCSTAAMSDDDTTTQEEYTSVARADARARTRGMK